MTTSCKRPSRLDIFGGWLREVILRLQKNETIWKFEIVLRGRKTLLEWNPCTWFLANFRLRWFDTVFSGPYLAFSIGILPTFPQSDQCENYPSFCVGFPICVREQSDCHMASPRCVDWVPLARRRTLGLSVLVQRPKAWLFLSAVVFLASFELFLRFRGSLRS